MIVRRLGRRGLAPPNCIWGVFCLTAEVADLAGGNEGIPGAAVDWKPKVDAWPRSTRGYKADVGLYYLPGLRGIYLDGVIS